jgi:putative membrane protein
MPRNVRSLFPVSTLVLATVLACGGGTPSPNARPDNETNTAGSTTEHTDTPATSDTSGPTSAASTLSDPQIALITDSVNSAEIAQARLAQDRAKNERVRQFASMMADHHSQARKEQSELALDEAESPLSAQLAAESKATLEKLQNAVGADFDRAYIEAQVEAHQKALSTIQNDLRPNARHPKLQAYLDELAPRVSQHLEEARATQQALERSGGTTSSR